MKEPLSDYIKVGIVHFMAFPECMGGEGPVFETIEAVAMDPFFEAVEITHIADAETRGCVKGMLEQARMAVCFGAQPMLLGGGLDLNHAEPDERRKAVDKVKAGIDEAGEMGITNVGMLSGRPDANKKAAMGRLVESLNELCAHGEPKGVNVVLETFDQLSFGKNCLIGPTSDAIEISAAVRETHGSFGLMLDLSHLPLIGETSYHAIKTADDHMVHVHIGNCAMDDPDHAAYGDNHPRFGAPGTRNDIAELAEFLKVLLETGYLGTHERKIVSFEVRPMPGESSEAIIAGSKRALTEAWRRI